MKACLAAVLAVGAVVGMTSFASAASQIVISPSVAPNLFGSPSASGYINNAITGLESGVTTVGDRTTNPTGYTGGVTQVAPGQIEVTSFNSWEGNANPTGAFAGEYGNRLHFGLAVQSDSAFSLSAVSFAIHSDDAGDDLLYTGDLSGTNFGTGTRVGLSYGTDGIKGTADDVLYNTGNAGSDSVKINELYYVGVGNAEWPGGSDPDPANPLLGRQGAIDDTSAWILANIHSITGSYSIRTDTAGTITSSATVTVVPLPSSVAMGLGLMATIGAGTMLRKKLRLA